MRPGISSIIALSCAVLLHSSRHASAEAGGTGTVEGTVSEAGRPVVNARVTLFTDSLFYFAETRTTAAGAFAFSDVPVGRKFLGVAVVGYDYEQVLIDVSAFPWVEDFNIQPETEPGCWEVIGNTEPELFDATDIGLLLPDGTIFFCHDTVDPIRFDPVTGKKTFPAGSGVEQGCMNGTLLDDGSIVMIGGQSPSDPGAFTNAVPWVKRYSPADDAWEGLAPLEHRPGRWYPGLARLADGSLLVMGGGQAPDAMRTDTCERFDKKTQSWSYTDSMFNPTEFPPSALLYTGEVLATWWPPQLYNPVTEQWRLTGNFVQPNRFFPGHSDHSLVVLEDGRALAVGVVSGPDGNTHMAEIFDPATETWSTTSNPDLIRYQTELVQLPDGRILVAAGHTEGPPPVKDILGIVQWCDLYEPASDTWRRVADLIYFREYHAVTLLVPDGRVVTTGGTQIQFQYGPITSDIEAYSPPYLFRGVRPQVASVSNLEPRRGETIVLDIEPQTQITSVVLMGAQTTTHWVDGGIPRRLVLPVEQNGSAASVTLPLDPNRLPLGRYMLFAMVDDIPSSGKMINVLPASDGDFNGDGSVGAADLAILLGNWGPCNPPPPQWCPGDLDGDGVVGPADLAVLLGAWG